MLKPSVISGIIVLALSGYVGYDVAYVRPREAVERIQQQLKEAREEQALRTRVALSLQTLEQKRTQLALRPDPDWFLTEVGAVTKEAGIQVTSISPQSPKPGADGTALFVSLQVITTYHQLGRFLSRLESRPRLIRVDQLDVTPEQGFSGKVRVHLVLRTLYVPPVVTSEVSTPSP